MDQNVYEVITEYIIPAGKPVQGKTQMGQRAPERLFCRVLHGLAEGLRCEIGNMDLLILDDTWIIIEMPCGLEGVAVYQYNKAKKDKKYRKECSWPVQKGSPVYFSMSPLSYLKLSRIHYPPCRSLNSHLILLNIKNSGHDCLLNNFLFTTTVFSCFYHKRLEERTLLIKPSEATLSRSGM